MSFTFYDGPFIKIKSEGSIESCMKTNECICIVEEVMFHEKTFQYISFSF